MTPGNAKIAGMSKDLHLVGYRYNIAAAVFFVRNAMLVATDADDVCRSCIALPRFHRMSGS